MSSYLFAWLLFLGLALGGMANLMLHNLTGGAWGGAVRPAFIACARLVPLAALLGLPVLIGMRELYPIAEGGWFGAAFFVARSVAYLLVWSALGFFVRTSAALSAVGLIVYAFTMSLAATDWIASLVPQWYSTGFGLVVAIGQMLAAMALAVAYAGLRWNSGTEPGLPPRPVFQHRPRLFPQGGVGGVPTTGPPPTPARRRARRENRYRSPRGAPPRHPRAQGCLAPTIGNGRGSCKTENCGV